MKCRSGSSFSSTDCWRASSDSAAKKAPARHFSRIDGSPWSTDKDGIIAALLAAEITGKTGRDPGELYAALVEKHGPFVYERIDAPATAPERAALAKITADDVNEHQLAGERILGIFSQAPGDGNPIGGIKVTSDDGWFAVRPSGTEDVYKIYAESYRDEKHLRKIQEEARAIVRGALPKL